MFDEAGDVQKFFVSSGTTTIHADSTVHIVCEEVCDVADIDGAGARSALEAAQGALNQASGEVAKAEAQVQVDVFSAMVAAA